MDTTQQTPAQAIATAYRLYIRYQTTTPAYRALAARLGYVDAGDLNAVFSRRLAAEQERRARARYAAKHGR